MFSTIKYSLEICLYSAFIFDVINSKIPRNKWIILNWNNYINVKKFHYLFFTLPQAFPWPWLSPLLPRLLLEPEFGILNNPSSGFILLIYNGKHFSPSFWFEKNKQIYLLYFSKEESPCCRRYSIFTLSLCINICVAFLSFLV